MKDLIDKYNSLKAETWELYKQLQTVEDGFKYVTVTNSYGSTSKQHHNNSFTVQELCNEYNGDNGYCNVYTNNPNHNITTEGSITVVGNFFDFNSL